jgi:hypothetical protein
LPDISNNFRRAQVGSVKFPSVMGFVSVLNDCQKSSVFYQSEGFR